PGILFGALAFVDVDHQVDRADQSAFLVVKGSWKRNNLHTAAVRTLSDRFQAAYGPVFLQGHGHGTLAMREQCAVRPVELPGAAPLRLAEFRPASPKDRGRFVEVDYASARVGGVNGHGQDIERLAKVVVAPVRLITRTESKLAFEFPAAAS